MTSKRGLPALLPPNTDGPLRLRYLREVSALLWPPPAVVTIGGRWRAESLRNIITRWPPPAEVTIGGREPEEHTRGDTVRDFVLVPSSARPRLLVPADSRRAAAAAVTRYAEPGSSLARARSRVLGLSLASGAGMALMRERVRVRVPRGTETIETYLRAALGRDLTVSLHIGPARANRKPVLQLLSHRGETLGFAKIGVGALTNSLVRAERDALHALGKARLRATEVPAVVHHGVWNGMDILVQSPLPVWLPRERLGLGRLGAAMREIAEVGGVHRDTLAASTYWAALSERLARLEHDDNGQVLRRAAERLAARKGGTDLAFGAWHGDWTPWNMAVLPHTLLVWDWERFGPHAPLGFDALHYRLQAAVARDGAGDPARAAAETLSEAPALLSPFGVGHRAARLCCLLYLIEVGARYLTDGQAEAGARLGVVESWLLPVLMSEVERL